MGSTGRVFPRSSPAWGPPTSARSGKIQLEFEGECRYRSRMMALQGARLGIGSAPYQGWRVPGFLPPGSSDRGGVSGNPELIPSTFARDEGVPRLTSHWSLVYEFC